MTRAGFIQHPPYKAVYLIVNYKANVANVALMVWWIFICYKVVDIQDAHLNSPDDKT